LDKQNAQNVVFGLVTLVIGLTGLLLPYRWNPLRLRKSVAALVSEKANLLIPRIVGILLVAVGAFVLIAALAGIPLR